MPGKKKNSVPPPFDLSLPATSANLGPAFDAAALAMDIYLKIKARAAKEFSIEATGRDADICAALENNLILSTYREVLESRGAAVVPLALRIINEIPIGKGCGSSAAARLAGIALANHFGRLRLTDSQITGEASRREHHPDNASACWMGGLAVARMSSESEGHVACIKPKGKWPLLLAIPEEVLATEQARQALPEKYSRADAVANIQNSMLLLAAFMEGRPELIASAIEDRMHQPYRAALCPLLPCLAELSGTRGVLGAVLSGAGPSVLVFVDPQSPLQKIKRMIAAHLERHQLRAELLLASIATRGGRMSRQK